MREVVDQAVQDGQGLVAAVQPHMDVDAVNDHLPSPPLGPVDELGVTRLVRHRLQLRRAERVAARAEQLHAHGIGDFADGGDGAAEVFFGFGSGLADPRDQFHGVEQQFLLDVRVFVVFVEFRVPGGHAAEHLVGYGSELARLPVHQCKLPLNTEGRLPR